MGTVHNIGKGSEDRDAERDRAEGVMIATKESLIVSCMATCVVITSSPDALALARRSRPMPRRSSPERRAAPINQCAPFLVHMKKGLRQPLLHTGMQLHTGMYARLAYTASPFPSLRFLRQWYSLRRSEAEHSGARREGLG